MIDTDFCLDPVTCNEDTMDPVLQEHQNKMGFGKGTDMMLDLKWRSTDVQWLKQLSQCLHVLH